MASTASTPAYKGKAAHRSWPQLPEELVRHITTFYLWDRAATTYTPATWDAREHWHQRMVYTSVRDALDLERTLMPVCPQWGRALETHFFWHQAIALLDPADALGAHAIVRSRPVPSLTSSQQQNNNANNNSTTNSSCINSNISAINNISNRIAHLTPYHHYRNILGCTCLICRVNAPITSFGLAVGKHTANTLWLGPIRLCRDHFYGNSAHDTLHSGRERRPVFCSLCLRDSPPYEHAPHSHPQQISFPSPEFLVCIAENDDDETWPGVDATCKSCRQEWLWQKASQSRRDREALGGPNLLVDDPIARQSVESFIDFGDGTIDSVLEIARDRRWLKKFTRLGDMLQQTLAAARFNSAPYKGMGINIRGDTDYEMLLEEEEEEEEDDDDEQLMQLEENQGVRDTALGDWARARILDGHWVNPADLWYGHAISGQPGAVPAVHPCPWTCGGQNERDEQTENESLERSRPHPSMETVRQEIPPSYALCEQAKHAHEVQMNLILLPAMRNLVRRIVVECALSIRDGNGHVNIAEETAMRARRMSLEDVLKVLREDEGVWFDGYDWAERKKNEQEEVRKTRVKGEKNHKSEDNTKCEEEDEMEDVRRSDSSSASSSCRSSGCDSIGSNATSPVLSTSTFQTTPSPSPVTFGEESDSSVDKKQPELDIEKQKEDGGSETTVTIKTNSLNPKTSLSASMKKLPIPISPVLNPPKLLRSIPYVPVTLVHLPPYSLEAFKSVWREACAPLYHCRCRICERAVAAANAASTADVNPYMKVDQNNFYQQMNEALAPQDPLQQLQKTEQLRQIDLKEVSEADIGLGSEEGYGDVDTGDDDEDADAEDEDEDEDLEKISVNGVGVDAVCRDEGREQSETVVACIPPVSTRSRKRSSDDLEDNELNHGGRTGKERDGSPPKRIKTTDLRAEVIVGLPIVEKDVERSVRKKRSSEELDDPEEREGGKRLKVENIAKG